MNIETLSIIAMATALLNFVSLALNIDSTIKTYKFLQEKKEKVKSLKADIFHLQKQLDFFRSCLYGEQKKAELLEEEITKLRIKK